MWTITALGTHVDKSSRCDSTLSPPLQVEEQRKGSAEDNEWNVREDTRLLDAVEMFGYGNWKDIAKHVETKGEGQVLHVHRLIHSQYT